MNREHFLCQECDVMSIRVERVINCGAVSNYLTFDLLVCKGPYSGFWCFSRFINLESIVLLFY